MSNTMKAISMLNQIYFVLFIIWLYLLFWLKQSN